jgi:hypothetical protein
MREKSTDPKELHTVYIPARICKKIEAVAKKNGHTFSKTVVLLLEEWAK